MYKIIRFFNQNRKQIFRIILIIVFLIGLLQLLNLFAKNRFNANNRIITNIINESNKNKEIISDKSLSTGQSISTTKLNNDVEVINKFIDYCNKKDYNSAYDMLTDECKEVMFSTIQDFYDIYYVKVFGGENKTYTAENWSGDIYQVRYTGDILSTGKIDGNQTVQDYITIVENNGEKKLNINSYVGRTKSNIVTEMKDINISVLSIDTYMDYEIYNLSVQNNSKNNILLDTGDNPKSVYLLDQNNAKYYFYNAEIIQTKLLVKSQYTNKIQIKFNKSYSSSRKIEKLVFSKLVLNYDEYNDIQDKEKYEFYQYGVNI